MSYVYDILINLNKKFYDFYDWNNNDKILHVKKLPIIKIKSSSLNNIKNGSVICDKKILDKIYKKTILFKDNKVINYLCAISDGKQAFVINLDSNGKVIEKSSLLLDEENEIVNMSKSMSEYEISYTELEKNDCIDFKTRNENEIYSFIKKELFSISNDKLKYLYLEYFNEKEENSDKIINRIFLEISNDFTNNCKKIYEFLKLTSLK